MAPTFKFTIISSNKPIEKNINRELQWLGSSLGLFNLRDKDSSCFRIFVEFVKSAKTKKPLSSDEVAYKLDLTRGTVVHHINKLMEAGIITHEGRKYLLRVDKLEILIDEIENDAKRAYEDLKKIAKDVDKWIGL